MERGQEIPVNYTIRPCRTLRELGACVELQKTIWGYAKGEAYPLRLFVNLARIGGLVLGAFASGNELAGFVASMPAWRGRTRYFHSLSLGVLPAHENQGLGRALKLEQRRRALRAGIDLIEWTYDPLRAKNAHFNLVRLGAIARQYPPAYYGLLRSRLQSGLPSDRLVCEWWLRSARVKRALVGSLRPPFPAQPVAEVALPPNLLAGARLRLERARAAQRVLGRRLRRCFQRGLAVAGFVVNEPESRYLLYPSARVLL